MCPEGAVSQESTTSIRHKVSRALTPLLRSLAGGRTLLSPNPPTTRPDQASATMMEKLDAALNSMSHGLEGAEIQGYLIGRSQPIAHHWHLITGIAVAREAAVAAG
jgi:hypothetical protein